MAATKKATPPKAPAKRKASTAAGAGARKSPRSAPAVKEKMTKTAVLGEIAENTGLTRKQVGSVLEELETLIERHIKKRSVGEFTLPGMLKIRTSKKPAQKARKGVPNPFKPGETMDIPARPASTRVSVTPLKKLKDMAQ